MTRSTEYVRSGDREKFYFIWGSVTEKYLWDGEIAGFVKTKFKSNFMRALKFFNII